MAEIIAVYVAVAILTAIYRIVVYLTLKVPLGLGFWLSCLCWPLFWFYVVQALVVQMRHGWAEK